MAHNVGQVVQLLPSHSRKNSVSSNYSRSSCSSYSETSSSNGSDYIFGSDIFFGNEFGAFPTTAESEHGAFPSAPSDSHRASNNTRNDTESILQKSAMAAFIASPNSSRWGDLVVSVCHFMLNALRASHAAHIEIEIIASENYAGREQD